MKFDHVGIAVRNIEQTLVLYSKLGGFEVRQTEVLAQKAKIALLATGDTSVELLQPTTDDSPLAKFLREKGEGLHHIAFAVDDVDKATEELRGKGLRFIYDKAEDGKFGSKVNFIHPKSAGGVLIELTQNSPTEAQS